MVGLPGIEPRLNPLWVECFTFKLKALYWWKTEYSKFKPCDSHCLANKSSPWLVYLPFVGVLWRNRTSRHPPNSWISLEDWCQEQRTKYITSIIKWSLWRWSKPLSTAWKAGVYPLAHRHITGREYQNWTDQADSLQKNPGYPSPFPYFITLYGRNPWYCPKLFFFMKDEWSLDRLRAPCQGFEPRTMSVGNSCSANWS